MAAPVRRDDEIELDVESLAYGGNGVARLNGYVVFVRRGLPGDRVRARVTKVKRNHAEALAVDVLVVGPAARGGAVRALPRLRRLPLPGSRVRGAARAEAAPGRGLAAPPRRHRRAAARGDRPGGVDLPLPQQARVLVHADARGRCARLPQGGPLGRGARDRALLAHVRSRQRDPQPRARLGARGTAGGVFAGRRHRLSPPPRRARRRQHAAGARDARDCAGRALRARPLRRGAARLSRGALDPLGRQRDARGGDERSVDVALGRGRDRRGAARPAIPGASRTRSCRRTRRWPSACTRSRSRRRG